MVRYRCLTIGGNANGCAGFGVAKANSPQEATLKAARMCKRNIFFVDRYQGAGLTRDLVGKHNSLKVILLAVEPHRGLHGNDLVCEILKYMGIADCTAKTFGNRNPYNVVRATFKALMTHESLEEIALKRGKRLVNLERAKYLQI
jgi:small subunit ribosomal protein S5